MTAKTRKGRGRERSIGISRMALVEEVLLQIFGTRF